MKAWALVNERTGKIREFSPFDEDTWVLAIFRTKKHLLETLDVMENEAVIRIEINEVPK